MQQRKIDYSSKKDFIKIKYKLLFNFVHNSHDIMYVYNRNTLQFFIPQQSSPVKFFPNPDNGTQQHLTKHRRLYRPSRINLRLMANLADRRLPARAGQRPSPKTHPLAPPGQRPG